MTYQKLVLILSFQLIKPIISLLKSVWIGFSGIYLQKRFCTDTDSTSFRFSY